MSDSEKSSSTSASSSAQSGAKLSTDVKDNKTNKPSSTSKSSSSGSGKPKKQNRGENYGSAKQGPASLSSTSKKSSRSASESSNKEKEVKYKKVDEKKKVGESQKAGEEEEDVEWETEPLALANQKKIALVIETLEKLKKEFPDRRDTLVEYYIQDIGDLESIEQSLAVDITVQYWWIDRNLIGLEDGGFDTGDFGYKLDIALSPAMEMEKLVEEGNDNHSIWITKAPGLGSYSDHGIVTSWQRFKGKIKAPLYLKDFPFDAQQVQFWLVSESEDSQAFKLHDITTTDGLESMTDAMIMNEWKTRGSIQRTTFDFVEPGEGRAYCRVQLSMLLQRRLGFYMSKVVFVLVLLGVIMSAAMIIPPDTINDRLQVAITLLLATVAFNFVTSELLPKISYSTWLDVYFNGIYVFLAVSVVEHITAFKLFERYGKRYATDFDYYAIGVFLFTFLLWTLLFIFRGLYMHKQIATRPQNVASKKKKEKIEKPTEI